MDCSLPGSSVHGIFQARILEWVAISFSRGSSWPRNWTGVSCVPAGSEGKASACNVGDLGLIPGLGRSSGEGNGNPLQYSCLENPMDRGAWWATIHGVAKSRTRLSNFYVCVCCRNNSKWSQMEEKVLWDTRLLYYWGSSLDVDRLMNILLKTWMGCREWGDK